MYFHLRRNRWQRPEVTPLILVFQIALETPSGQTYGGNIIKLSL